VRRRALIAAGVFLATPASATPLLDTAGPVGGNAGAQGVVSGPGAASTYFNPAQLIAAEDGFLTSFGFVSEQIGVTLDGRPAGSDVPLAVGARDVVGRDGSALPNDRVPTAWLASGCPGGTEPGTCPAPGLAARPRQSSGASGKTRTYLTLGFVKHVVSDRVAIGIYTMLPVSSFVSARSFYADEREALFSNSLRPELYGDRLTSLSFAFGGAVRILPTLSVGVSATLALANFATASTYVRDASNYDSLLLDTETRTQVDLEPIFGVRWTPSDRLRFGGTIHTPQSFDLETTVSAKLPAGSDSGTTRRDVYHWMPWRVALGAERDLVRRGAYTMAVTGSLAYAFWSSYQDRHGDRPSTYGQDLAWHDTMSGALGVRHVYGPVRGFIDLSFKPSPVPEQTGRSNYVDNDRVGLALGADLKIPLGGSFLRPGLQVSAQRLIPRHDTKNASRLVDELPDGSVFDSTRDPVPGSAGLQTNNPGYPGFGSGGYVWSGFFSLEIPL
jgi:long-chain fatty acid transport protein